MADDMVVRLAAIGDVRSHSMFGGYGLYLDAIMFGLVSASGAVHLRVDETTRDSFADHGGQPHGHMPYYSVPDAVMEDSDDLCAWAAQAAAIAQAARRNR